MQGLQRDSGSPLAKNVLDALENDTHTKKIPRKRLWQSTISEKKAGQEKARSMTFKQYQYMLHNYKEHKLFVL